MTVATSVESIPRTETHGTDAEQRERLALGLPSAPTASRGAIRPPLPLDRPLVRKRAIRASDVLNEALDYSVSFSRGLRVELPGGVTQLYLSGTASIGTNGETLYPGDLRAQCWRTYHNLTRLLESEGASWLDVVRTTCYLRDIERDYDEFNRIRNEFFSALALDPLPASTGIQARLCRSDLLVEIEATAILVARNEG